MGHFASHDMDFFGKVWYTVFINKANDKQREMAGGQICIREKILLQQKK